MADLGITAANVIAAAGATIEHALAGETITQGMGIYILAATGAAWKTINTSAVAAACRGVSLNSALAGQPLAYISAGSYNPGAVVAVGLQYGVTETAGGIALMTELAAGEFVTMIGIASTTSNIVVDIVRSGVEIA